MITLGTAALGTLDEGLPGLPPSYRLADESGPMFLAAEVEVYLPGGGDTIQGEALGVLALGTLTQQPQPVADFTTLRASDLGWVTRATDPAGVQAYAPILSSGVDLDRQMDLDPGGQGAAAGWGALRFVDDAGALTALAASRNADGRAVRIRLGRKQRARIDGIDLVQGVFLHPLLALPFVRTHSPATASATLLGRDAATWAEVGAGVPRFTGAAGGLLIEGERTNRIANARTPYSTGWTTANVANIVAVTGPDGQAGSAFQADDGLANASHNTGSPAFSVASGSTYVASALLRAGTCTIAQILLGQVAFGLNVWQNFVLTGAGSLGSGGAANTRAAITALGGGWYLCELGGTATATTTSNVFVSHLISSAAARAAAHLGASRTLTVAWPQFEFGRAASSPILPASGAPAQATRGADVIDVAASGLGIGAAGACTALLVAMLPNSAPPTEAQTLLHIDDGTNDNRFRLRNTAGNNALVLARSLAAAAVDSASLGNMTPGTPFRAWVTLDGAGAMRGALNDGAVQSVSGGPTTGLTRFHLGADATGAANMFGEVRRLVVLPYALPDAEAEARCAALPLD